MKSVLEHIFENVVEPYLAPQLKRGSIKAVQSYVSSIKVLREVALTSFRIGSVAGVLVTGLVLIVVGVIGLLPVTAQAALISVIVLGVVMTSVATYLALQGAKEKNWITWSKSNELIAAVTGEWENSLIPPNPRDVMSSQAQEAARSFDENQTLARAEHRSMRPPANEAAAGLPRPV